MSRIAGALFIPAFAFCACGGGESADGALEVRIYGEEFIEQKIPADAFVDGWSVTFDKFLVSVGGIKIQSGDGGTPVIDHAAVQVFDLAQSSSGDGYMVVAADVPGGVYDHVDYRIASDADATAANADAADATFMADNDYGLYIEGTATKDDVTKTFAWGFVGATTYAECHSTAVVDGNAAVTQLTIHGDHLFYDDLISSEPNVAFDLIAQADADGDGAITQPELAAVDITTQERYQVGSIEVEDLWSFIAYQATTVGHIDGEGHCEKTIRE